MDIKNLPQGGSKFRASLSKSGQPSLRKALNRLRVKNYAFRNLSKEDISTIVSVIKPAERSIRLKGGMSRYQVKSAKRKFWKTYKETKGTEHAFGKEDIKDAREIISAYKKHYGDQKGGQEQKKRVIPFRPYLDEKRDPRLGVTSASSLNNNINSIKDVTDRNIYGIKKEDARSVVSVKNLLDEKPIDRPPSTIISKPSGLLGRNLGSFPSSSIPKLPNRLL